MKHITFYFDLISPYAYLAFEKLPEALQGLSYHVTYKPVLFASFLKHHGQLGPAEIAPKRTWTYQQVLWQAHAGAVPLEMPASHPFNPLALLRLAVACSAQGAPNRYIVETLFHHVWRGGEQATDVARLAALTAQLKPALDPQGDEVKQQLRANTEEALVLGLFGVPTMAVDGELFWGLDALPMLRAFLQGDDWFKTDAWRKASSIPVGISRPKTVN